MAARTITARRAFLALALVVAAVVLVLAAPGLGLMAVPALALMLVLTLGYFPGEALLERARSHRARLPRASASVARRLDVYVRPVGRRFAFALAMRPPPAGALA